jgi:methylglyoxal reductase
VAARSKHLNVLGGARKIEQVKENAKAGDLVLEQADFERMTRDANTAIARAK